VRALVASGHDVVGLARSAPKADLLRELGAEPMHADIFDPDSLAVLFADCDAVCNFATHIPVGYAAALPASWRESDRLRTHGVRAVVAAAREAGVRRLVQEGVSFLYADNGQGWIDEQSPLGITAVTEPVSVGESQVQEYVCDSRHGVVLRLGTIVGDDPLTRWTLKAARHGRPIGLGDPCGWAHVVHTDDLGPAVLAALSAPSGIYNVGAEPVRRADLVQGFAEAAGQDHGAFLGRITKRVAGSRIEPLTRSLRVSSELFTAQTGWRPRRGAFDASWFDVLASEAKAAR
jgi:nucleoside-diphosphate-sugar epimerase